MNTHAHPGGEHDEPGDDARLRSLTVLLRDHFERFGYRGIDTPVLENLDLFLRKSGEEISARVRNASP